MKVGNLGWGANLHFQFKCANPWIEEKESANTPSCQLIKLHDGTHHMQGQKSNNS